MLCVYVLLLGIYLFVIKKVWTLLFKSDLLYFYKDNKKLEILEEFNFLILDLIFLKCGVRVFFKVFN